MCYDDQARPPAPPGETHPAHGEDIVLTASDGTLYAAFAATPAHPNQAQVIIYPDVRGLHQFYKELALRFAEVGITAIALDYFGRTAGLTSRDESFEYRSHVEQIQLTSFTLDVQAAQAYLAGKSGVSRSTFVVGFCMGGSLALLTGTNPAFGFAGIMPFYAGLSRAFGGQGSVLENAEKVCYPVLGQFGGDDAHIPESSIKELGDKMHVEHNLIIYQGAPHSFFDRKATEFAQASADAWTQMLNFIAAHTKQTQSA